MDYANVGSVQIGGPYQIAGPAKDTPSRRAIFVCQPRLAAEERACATKILSRMARLAYRRPVTKADVQTLLEFFDTGRQDGGSFDSGIQFALERVLVDPDFLLRVHRDPRGKTSASKTPYRLSDLEVASRLSFFLWSSIPDERLLDPGRARTAHESADPGKGSAANAGRPARHRRARRRFRRPVVESAPRRGSGGRSDPLSQLSTRVCCRRSSGKRSCLSPARCAKIAACWIC